MSEVGPFSGAVDIGEPKYYEELFIAYKLELKEQSMDRAELIYIGELRGNTPKEHWTGSISLEKRITEGELTETEVNETTSHLNESFVPVAEGANKRCVDGSTVVGYDDKNPESYGRALGPQIQGGTVGDASGNRLAKGFENGATLLGDVEAEIESDRSKFEPGDHTDVHADETKTGCGQIDGHDRRSAIYADDRFDTLVGSLKSVFEAAKADFPADKVNDLKSNGLSIHEHAAEYYGDKSKILDLLKGKNANAIEKLTRPHNEVSLTLNFDSGYVFHRDHYNQLTNGKIQNFNLDVWNIIEEHGEEAIFVLADAVATLMDLTDGSLKVFLRLPKTSNSPVAA